MPLPPPEPDAWTPDLLGGRSIAELEELVIKHQVNVIAANRRRVTRADLVHSLLAWKASFQGASSPSGAAGGTPAPPANAGAGGTPGSSPPVQQVGSSNPAPSGTSNPVPPGLSPSYSASGSPSSPSSTISPPSGPPPPATPAPSASGGVSAGTVKPESPIEQKVDRLIRQQSQRRLIPWFTLASLLVSTYITVWSVAVGEVRFTPDRLFPFPIFEWRFPSENQGRIEAPDIQWSEDPIRTVSLKADMRMQPKNGEDHSKNNLYYFVIDASTSANSADFDTRANAPWVTDSIQLIKEFLDFSEVPSGGAIAKVDRLSEASAQTNWQVLKSASIEAAKRYNAPPADEPATSNPKETSQAKSPDKSVQDSPNSRLQKGRLPFFHASLLATAAKLIQMEPATHSSQRGYLRLDLLGGRLEPQIQKLSDQDAGRGGAYPSPQTVAGFIPITTQSIRKSVVLLLTAFENGNPTGWEDNDLKVTDFEKVFAEIGRIGDAMHPAAHRSEDSIPPPAPELHLVAFSDFDHSVELRHRRDNTSIRRSWINTENQFVAHCTGGSITLLAVAPEGVELDARDDYPRAQRVLQKASVLLPREFFNRHTVEEFALATTRFDAPERVKPYAVFYYSGGGDVETHLETDLPAGGALSIRWFMDSASRASGSYAFSYQSKETNGQPVSAGHLYSERQMPLSFNSGSAAPTLRIRLESPVFQSPETLLISSDRLQKPLLLPVSCQQIISLSTSWVLLIIYVMIWLAVDVIVAMMLLRRFHPRGIVGSVLGIILASVVSLGLGCLIPVSMHKNWYIVLICCLAFMAVLSWLLWFHHSEDELPEHQSP